MIDDSRSCNQGESVFRLCHYYLYGKCYFDKDGDKELPCEEYIDRITEMFREFI